MSDRLDEFAIKTNMKLEDFNLTPTNSNTVLINNGNNNNNMINNSNNNSNKNDVLILNDLNSLNPSLINLDQLTSTNQSANHSNKIYFINNSGGVNAPMPIGHHSHNNKNDVFILNDLNTLNPSISLDQLTQGNSSSHANKIFLINNNATITATNDLIRPLIKLDVIICF